MTHTPGPWKYDDPSQHPTNLIQRELLAALESVIAAWEKPNNSLTFANALQKARAAIALAKGESK